VGGRPLGRFPVGLVSRTWHYRQTPEMAPSNPG